MTDGTATDFVDMNVDKYIETSTLGLYPNIYYHIHLFQQMLDYRPMATHTAFNFERYNQDLKGIRTNHKGSIETTIAKKFIQQIHKEDFYQTVPKLGIDDVTVEQLKCAYLGKKSNLGSSQCYEDNILSYEFEVASDDDFSLLEFINFSGHLDRSGPRYTHAYGYETLPYSCIQSLKIVQTISCLNDEQYYSALTYYQTYFNPVDEVPYILDKDHVLFGQQNNTTIVDKRIAKFTSITILGQKYSSNEASSPKRSFIRAYFRDLDIDLNSHQLRPCQIHFFFSGIPSTS